MSECCAARARCAVWFYTIWTGWACEFAHKMDKTAVIFTCLTLVTVFGFGKLNWRPVILFLPYFCCIRLIRKTDETQWMSVVHAKSSNLLDIQVHTMNVLRQMLSILSGRLFPFIKIIFFLLFYLNTDRKYIKAWHWRAKAAKIF